jgi:protein-disulfide isomerase
MSSRVGPKRSARMVRDQIAREKRRSRTLWASIAAVAVLVIAGLIGWGVVASQDSGDFTAPPGAVENGTGVKVGSGPVQIDIYEDFICPACGQFEQQVGSYIEEQVSIGAISVEYRPIAFLDRMSTTDYSSRAVNAAACVFDNEGAETFHEFHDLLFANQPPEGGTGLSDDELTALAEQAGADDVDSCIADGEFDGWVEEANDSASQNNVVSTPTVYVAGEEVNGAGGGVPSLQDLLNAVLAASAAPGESPS